jgi:hypothetical protein
MNFELTEEQVAVRDAARDFAQNVLKQGVIERDRDQKFPTEEIKQLGELGFLGIMVDPKYGGAGMDALCYVLAMEEDRCFYQCNHERKQLTGLLWYRKIRNGGAEAEILNTSSKRPKTWCILLE